MYTIIMKKCETQRELLNCGKEAQREWMLLEKWGDGFAQLRVATNFQLVIKMKPEKLCRGGSACESTGRGCSRPALHGEEEESCSVGVRGSMGGRACRNEGPGSPRDSSCHSSGTKRSPLEGNRTKEPHVSEAWATLVAQRVKNLPARRETWVRSLGWEDLLEEGMAAHSSIPAWRNPWTEEPGGLQSTASQSQTRPSDSHTGTATQPRAAPERPGAGPSPGACAASGLTFPV